MSKPIEWISLILTNWKVIGPLLLILIPYSGYNGYNQIQAYRAEPAKTAEVTVNVESQPTTSNYDIDQRVKKLSNDALQQHRKEDHGL